MKVFKTIIAVFLLSLSVSMMSLGCNKGPAEEAGEKVDEAVEQGADKLEDAGEAVKEAAEEAKE
jgi:hypothetical protein